MKTLMDLVGEWRADRNRALEHNAFPSDTAIAAGNCADELERWVLALAAEMDKAEVTDGFKGQTLCAELRKLLGVSKGAKSA